MVSDILSRRKKDREKYGERLPDGQKVVEDWPVLTYGGTPRASTSDWRLRIFGLVEKETELDWKGLTALPRTKVHTDIHCVTTWSKMDTNFEGVSIPDLLKQVQVKPEAKAVIAHCYGGYTANLLLDDFVRDENLLAYIYEDEPLPADDDVAAERVALEHEVESLLQPLLRHLPGDERALRQVRREQRLPHPPDRSRLQQCPDALDHVVQRYARLLRDLGERVSLEPLELVFRHFEYRRVDGIRQFERDGNRDRNGFLSHE